MISSIRVHGGVFEAGRAEGLGVHVPAPVAPQVPAPAVGAKMNGAAIAEHDGRILSADLAECFAVRDNHGGLFFLVRQNFCANLSDERRKGKTVAPIRQKVEYSEGVLENHSSIAFQDA